MNTPISGVGGSEEGRLVRQAVSPGEAGRREGIHFLYVRFHDDVLRYVNSLVRDYHEAEDITHNVFAKLMTAITKYEERAVPFTAWIMRVARNAALDHLRARRAVPTEEVRVAETAEADSGLERGLDIREALEELPTDQREVLVLRHVIGLSPGRDRRHPGENRELRSRPPSPRSPRPAGRARIAGRGSVVVAQSAA